MAEVLKEKLPTRKKYTVICPVEETPTSFKVQVSHVLAVSPQSAVDLIHITTGQNPNLVLEGHANPVWPVINEVKL